MSVLIYLAIRTFLCFFFNHYMFIICVVAPVFYVLVGVYNKQLLSLCLFLFFRFVPSCMPQ